MAKENLFIIINGEGYPFGCEEVTKDGDHFRKFRITDITSDHILFKDPDDSTWKQEDDKVEIYPKNLKAIGETLEKFYKL